MPDQSKRLVYFLPNTFTALNMGCGFAAILMAFNQKYLLACVILILGAIFDSVDGRIARLTGTQSHFGEEFDSLSDLVSFGMTPALLFYLKFLEPFGRLGMVSSFMFLLCGALRLARFNSNIEKISSDYFQGLPIPSAAMAAIGYVLLNLEFPRLIPFGQIHIAFILILAFFMVSNIPFPSFKQSEFVKNHKRYVLISIVAMLLTLVLYVEIFLVVITMAYILGSVVYYFLNYQKLSNVFEIKNKELD